MNARALPLKRSKSCTKMVSVRVEDELKQDLKRLDDQGYDTPEWLRLLIRDGISRLKKDGKL